MAKLDNMMAILWILRSGGKITAKEISEKLEINIRTVYRYIDKLSASGVPIISDTGHNGGYTLLQNFIKAPLFFDVEEQTALLQAANLAKEAGYFLDGALSRATRKLKLHLNQDQEKALAKYLEGFDVITPIYKSIIEPTLKRIKESMVNELAVEIEYQTKQEAQARCRIIDPYGIVYWNNNWYVIAYCHLRKEIRCFRVDRIANVVTTDMRFTRPEGFSAGDFFISGIVPPAENNKKLMELIISGKTSALDDLCQHWFLGHYLKERTLKKAIFLLQNEVIDTYIPYLLLPYGKSIQIIKPLSLKPKVVEVLEELTKYYQI